VNFNTRCKQRQRSHRHRLFGAFLLVSSSEAMQLVIDEGCHFLQCAFIHFAPREKQREADIQVDAFSFEAALRSSVAPQPAF
jgi:hypothetical protein